MPTKKSGMKSAPRKSAPSRQRTGRTSTKRAPKEAKTPPPNGATPSPGSATTPAAKKNNIPLGLLGSDKAAKPAPGTQRHGTIGGPGVQERLTDGQGRELSEADIRKFHVESAKMVGRDLPNVPKDAATGEPDAAQQAAAAAPAPAFAPLVGPNVKTLQASALDMAQRAAVQAATLNDVDAAANALPDGVILEKVGLGWQARTSGMHKIYGTGATILEAIKKLGVHEVRDDSPKPQSAAVQLAPAEKGGEQPATGAPTSGPAGEEAAVAGAPGSARAKANQARARTASSKAAARTGSRATSTAKATEARGARGARRTAA